jgi:hypothetical protein
MVMVMMEDIERLRRTSGQKHPQIFFRSSAIVVVVHGRITASGNHRRRGGHVVVVVVVVVTRFLLVASDQVGIAASIGAAATGGQCVMMFKHGQVRMVAASASQSGASQRRVQSRLLLKEAMDFEPIGSSAVTGAAFRHAHQEAFAQSAGLARRPVLLVDDALTAILALTDGRHITVRPAEKRLEKK